MTDKPPRLSPEALRRKLISLLEGFEGSISDDSIRDQVRQLIPVNKLLRDLGGSVLMRPDVTSARSRILLYLLMNVGKVVAGDELMVAAGISEYARRIRELRVEHGWPIISGVTAAQIADDKDSVRRKVLQRDGHRCQDCEWHHDLWNPSDPRHLEVHHLVMHSKRGSNTEENLLTLCNICHDDRHGTENSATK